jgi:propionate CoA-transferase
VEIVTYDGQDYLAYKTFPVNVAILRGTTADTDGNITMEKEALTIEALAIAMAAKNSGGFVIVQVERIADRGTLNARQVKIPGIMVDCVILSRPKNHCMTFVEPYNPAYSAEMKVPMQSLPPMDMGERKIIARKGRFRTEGQQRHQPGHRYARGGFACGQRGEDPEYITLTAEPGTIGGMPAGGLSFGASTNPECVIDQPYQFDFYDGGGLDCCFLGWPRPMRRANLNVSKFGTRLAVAEDSSTSARMPGRWSLWGTFTADGLKVSVQDGKILSLTGGNQRKFLRKVEQVTFSGHYARMKGQPVYYITERCVFSLTQNGMELIEVAPASILKETSSPTWRSDLS